MTTESHEATEDKPNVTISRIKFEHPITVVEGESIGWELLGKDMARVTIYLRNGNSISRTIKVEVTP